MENNDGFAGDGQLLRYLEIRFLEALNCYFSTRFSTYEVHPFSLPWNQNAVSFGMVHWALCDSVSALAFAQVHTCDVDSSS